MSVGDWNLNSTSICWGLGCPAAKNKCFFLQRKIVGVVHRVPGLKSALGHVHLPFPSARLRAVCLVGICKA